jgi:hypothetical protein
MIQISTRGTVLGALLAVTGCGGQSQSRSTDAPVGYVENVLPAAAVESPAVAWSPRPRPSAVTVPASVARASVNGDRPPRPVPGVEVVMEAAVVVPVRVVLAAEEIAVVDATREAEPLDAVSSAPSEIETDDLTAGPSEDATAEPSVDELDAEVSP